MRRYKDHVGRETHRVPADRSIAPEACTDSRMAQLIELARRLNLVSTEAFQQRARYV
jgi:hypothetical protein